MSTDIEPFDWTQPFRTANALSPDVPSRGRPSLEKLDDERPPLERHAEQVRAYALDIVGREPTPQETAGSIEQADSLRAWIAEQGSGPEAGPEFYQELEEKAYRAGLLAVWWGLAGDMPKLREFLQFMRDWQGKVGPDAITAMTRAERRESAEWHVVAQAIGQMEYQATALKSPRLAEAAKVMRAMLTADKLRPEAPAKEARTTGAKKAATVKHARTGELKARVIAACLSHKRGTQWKNPAARKVAPDAFQWNSEARDKETGRTPFTWSTIAAAERQVRRWLDN